MKIVKVTYTTTAAFAETNQNNIKQVMDELQEANHSGINYNACLSTDNKTFIHTAFFKTDEDQKFLNELSTFKHFQQELKANRLEIPPKQELLSLIGSSNTIFNNS